MGSLISYYLKSAPMQSLEDYMSSYYIAPYFKDDDPDTNSNICPCNSDIAHDTNYYKLYIYIHESDAEMTNVELKNMYEESSKKHNNRVEKYLQDCDASLSVSDETRPINCYDSGFDLFCPENIEWQDFSISSYMLDHKISCAMTYEGKFVGYYLYMRSSTPLKTPLRLANNVGIIDSGYRGNIKAYFDIKESNFNFVKGHRYMQICPPNIGMPMKVIITDSISILGENSSRKTGGLGSTGD